MSVLDPRHYTVAWIAPLQIEARAALGMLDNRHRGSFPVNRGDDYVFLAGDICGHNIIIATLPAGSPYGTASAASLASQVKKSFPNLWFGLLVGVAAGLPDPSKKRDIRLGDVLVGIGEGETAGLVAYDLGKETEDGFQPLRGGHALAMTESIVRSAIGNIQLESPNEAELFRHYYEKIQDVEHLGGTFQDPGQELDQLFFESEEIERKPRESSKRTRVWYGPIGSGEKLMKNARIRDEYRDKYGLIGLEMEAAGTMNTITVGVIRGVCDYGDRHKNKEWQPYAAAMAAAFAKAVLKEIVPKQNSREEALSQKNTNVCEQESSRPWTVPFRQNRDFISREALRNIQEICTEPAGRAALFGLGGVGKSQIAIEYAYQLRSNSPNVSVFWVHASTQARFEEGYRHIARSVALPELQDAKADVYQLVHDWLRDDRKGTWVLILDNVDDASFLLEAPGTTCPLKDYIPRCPHGSVLVTTRSRVAAQVLVNDRDIITVKPMEEAEGLELLQKKLGEQEKSKEIVELATELEYMPLALAQAAAYISQRRPRCSVQQYLADLCRSDRKKTARLKSGSEEICEELGRDHEAKNSIIITWQISFDYIRKTRSSAAELLSLMSFFDRQGIPEQLLRARSRRELDQDNASQSSTDDDSFEDDDDSFEEDVKTLRDYSFISANMDGKSFEMHRLVQLAMRNWLQIHDGVERWKQRFVNNLYAAFPWPEYENWAMCQALFPHAQAAVGCRPADKEARKAWASVLGNAACYAQDMGQYNVAKDMHQSALDVRKALLGLKHPETLASMDNLGTVLFSQGKHKEAQKMYRQALEGKEKALGKEHPSTLITMNNLATALTRLGEEGYDEAEAIYQRTLEARERILGKEHPATLGSKNSLAHIMRLQKNYEKAEVISRQVLDASKRVLGKEHPKTLFSANLLASILQDRGKDKEAEVMHREVLEASERVLGKEHPYTLTSVYNLGLVLRSQRKFEEAEVIIRRAVAGREKVYGKEHEYTLNSVYELGRVLSKQGKFEEAEMIFRRAAVGYEKVLGKEYEYTLHSVYELGIVLSKQGKFEEAEMIFRRAAVGYENVYRKEHEYTLDSVYELGIVLSKQGKFEEAEAMFRRAVTGREKTVGEEHNYTRWSLARLVSVLRSQGKYEEAEEIRRSNDIEDYLAQMEEEHLRRNELSEPSTSA